MTAPRVVRFRIPFGHGIDEELRKKLKPQYTGYVVESVEKRFETPIGDVTVFVEALKFEDGKYAVRIWYRKKWPDGSLYVNKGLYLKEDVIEGLSEEIENTVLIKHLLKRLTGG